MSRDGDFSKLREAKPFEGRRLSTGIVTLDAVFGTNPDTGESGIHLPSVTIWAGKAGLGKTALLLEMLANLIRNGVRCAFISAEQHESAVRANVIRLGLDEALRDLNIFCTLNDRPEPSNDMDRILEKIHRGNITLAVVDSINELVNDDDNPADEFNNQDRIMKTFIGEIVADPKNLRALVIVSHMNSSDQVTGKKKTQHKADVTALLERGVGEEITLSCPEKNRYGKTGVRARFRMDHRGKMVEIPPLAPLPPVESGALVPITTEVAPAVDIAVTIAAPLVTEPVVDEFDEPQTPASDPRFEGLLASSAARRRSAS